MPTTASGDAGPLDSLRLVMLVTRGNKYLSPKPKTQEKLETPKVVVLLLVRALHTVPYVIVAMELPEALSTGNPAHAQTIYQVDDAY